MHATMCVARCVWTGSSRARAGDAGRGPPGHDQGIPQKLLAFEKFLEEHPEWRDKVLLVQIAVPSRTDVPEYQARRPHRLRLPCEPRAGRWRCLPCWPSHEWAGVKGQAMLGF